MSNLKAKELIVNKSLNLKLHLDRVDEVRKLVSNASDPPRLSQPIPLAPEEQDRTGDLLQVVLRGLLSPVNCPVLLRCGEAVGSELLGVYSLPEVVKVL